MSTKKRARTRRVRRKEAFEFDDRQPSGKKLDSEFSRSSAKDPMALEMGEYVDEGKGLPKVKKESSTKKDACGEGPRRPAMKKERAMKRRKKSMPPQGEFTKQDDEEMMRMEAADRPMGMPRKKGMKPYGAEEDEMPMEGGEEFAVEELELEDLDFGDLPELDEEEVEEVAECPPGCVPESEADDDEEGDEEEEGEGEEEGEEGEGEEGEGEEEEGGGEEEEDDAKEASVEEPAEEEPVVADAEPEPDNFAYVIAEDQMDSIDIRDLDFPLYDHEGENPHYLVLHKGEPVAKIALQDQEMPEDHRGPFLSEKYVRTLTGSIERVGMADTLQNVNAKIYAASASRGHIADEMKKAAKAEMDGAFRNNIANLQDNLLNTITLAIDASVKNVILENPLKEALVVGMRKAGVSERGAVEIVESAFHEKGTEYFQSLAQTAEEWMGMPDEAYKSITSMVSTANYVHPEDRNSGYVFDDEDSIHEADSREEEILTVPNNVPLRSVASPRLRREAGATDREDAESYRTQLRGKLNVRGKLFQGE